MIKKILNVQFVKFLPRVPIGLSLVMVMMMMMMMMMVVVGVSTAMKLIS